MPFFNALFEGLISGLCARCLPSAATSHGDDAADRGCFRKRQYHLAEGSTIGTDGIGRTTRNDQARLTFRSNQYLNQHSDFFAVGDASIHRQIDTLVSWTSGCEVLHICAIACVG